MVCFPLGPLFIVQYEYRTVPLTSPNCTRSQPGRPGWSGRSRAAGGMRNLTSRSSRRDARLQSKGARYIPAAYQYLIRPHFHRTLQNTPIHHNLRNISERSYSETIDAQQRSQTALCADGSAIGFARANLTLSPPTARHRAMKLHLYIMCIFTAAGRDGFHF